MRFLQIYIKISEVPKDYIFSKDAVFKYYNRHNKLETYINGIQADAYIGIQDIIRKKMLQGELDVFTTDDCYIKFEKAVF